MTAISGTYQTYQQVGIREDLSNLIYDISPVDTPFMTSAGRGSASNTNFEWQTDALSTPSTTNAHIEGDDIATFEASVPTVRLGNYTQISRKTLLVSGTADAVNTAGRAKELAYQAVKRGKEMKRDMESILLCNQAANAGSGSTARKTGTVLGFVKTNVNKASNGVNPVYTTVATDPRTDGDQRTFTEAMLKDVIAKCWESGATPTTVMVGAYNKQVMSTFPGIAEKRMSQSSARATAIIGAADIYVSDFGNLAIVPNRFQRARDAFVLDFDYVSVDYLRPFQTKELAKTGDAEKRLMIVEYGLRVKNEKALGLVADLTTA
jgi:hypothetical protein